MIENFSEISCDFIDHGVFLSFSGLMSQDLMVEMGEIVKTKMKLEGASISTILKVFSILVELNQNIIHYSAERLTSATRPTENGGCGLIAIGQEMGHYFLLSGNLIEVEKVERLEQRLTWLNQLNSDDLKRYYKESRKKTPDQDSKGAGLGFIEVARKTSRPLEFDFQPIDARMSFFSLKTTI